MLLKFPRVYMTTFQSQMPRMWGISCYAKKCVQKAHFKHPVGEEVTPFCCVCSSGRKQKLCWPPGLCLTTGQGERDDSPLKDGQERGGEHTAGFWRSRMTAVAESSQKQYIWSLVGDQYFYCSWREGVRASFGDCWVAICFLTWSWSVVVLLFENRQMILA